jgi:hypothetical protein
MNTTRKLTDCLPENYILVIFQNTGGRLNAAEVQAAIKCPETATWVRIRKTEKNLEKAELCATKELTT